MNAFITGHQLPRLTAVLLGGILIWQVAHWWLLEPRSADNPGGPGEAATATRASAASGGGATADSGLTYPLFGLSARGEPGTLAPPPTTLGLVLRGVLALGDGRGYALIDAGGAGASASRPAAATSDRADGLFAVGDVVVGRVKLYRVYRDHVVLQTMRGLESLALDPNATHAPVARVHMPMSPTRTMHRAVLNPIQSRQVTQVMNDPMQFRRYLRVVPVRRDGRQMGYQVSPAGNPRLFSALGLRSGDVVTRVNGTPLDGGAINTFELVRALHGARELSLRVLRNGHEIPLHVVLQGQ